MKMIYVTLDIKLIQGEIQKNCKDPYHKLTQIFRDITEHLFEKTSGNQAPFMTKELSGGIVAKSKAKNLLSI